MLTETTIRAAGLGAIDFVSEPKIGITAGGQGPGRRICEASRAAARARMHRPAGGPDSAVNGSLLPKGRGARP